MPHITRRFASIILLVLSVCVATFVWWINYGEITNPTGTPAEPNYSQVEDGLYIGGAVQQPPPGTRAVLNLCEIEDPYHCEIHPWPSHKIPDAAPAPSIEWLREQVNFVDEQRRAGLPVYIHCAAGVSRAAMVTTAYLMFKNNWTRDEALAFLRTKRPQVNPNPAFMELLKQWERESWMDVEALADGIRKNPRPGAKALADGIRKNGEDEPRPDPEAPVLGKFELLKALDNLKQFAPADSDLAKWKWEHLQERVIGDEPLKVMPREVK
jgi:Dual specificity phosphatase, catalytic domain